MKDAASPEEIPIEKELIEEEKKKTYPATLRKFGRLISDRWPEYILEILVVIIGISISFTLSNIKEEASDRTLEQMYLKGLLEDISSDIHALEATIKETNGVIQSGETLMEQSRTDQVTIEKAEFVKLVRSVVSRPHYISKNATFSALKSSGYFHLIQDNELKNLLFEYDQQYQGLKSMEMAELQVTASITGPYIIKYIPIDDQANSDRLSKNLNLEKIIKDIEFGNNITLRLGNRIELLESYTQTLTIANKIKTLLNTNLK